MNSIVKEKQYISNVLSVPFENLSQSYLQKAVALGTQSVISFPVQTSQVASPLVTDNLLNLNDEFVVTHYTVFLRSVGSDSPTNTQLLNALPALPPASRYTGNVKPLVRSTSRNAAVGCDCSTTVMVRIPRAAKAVAAA